MNGRLALAALALGLAGCGTSGDPTAAKSTGEPGLASAPSTSAAPSVQGPAPAGTVPAGALLSPADLGEGWTAAAALDPPCASPYAHRGRRAAGFAHSKGVLTETLATEVDIPAAVAGWRTSLARCGYAVQEGTLGEASVVATSPDRSDALVVTGAEGVLIVAHAHGALAGSNDDLDSWSDMMFGTSCVAAPDGCH